MTFANVIIKWYEQNKRDLPWRNTTDPYHIWISEIILQQTQVAQGYDYYLRFIKRFPNDITAGLVICMRLPNRLSQMAVCFPILMKVSEP